MTASRERTKAKAKEETAEAKTRAKAMEPPATPYDKGKEERAERARLPCLQLLMALKC